MNIQVGNAGYSTATGSRLESIIPAGFTGVVASDITCTAIG